MKNSHQEITLNFAFNHPLSDRQIESLVDSLQDAIEGMIPRI